VDSQVIAQRIEICRPAIFSHYEDCMNYD